MTNDMTKIRDLYLAAFLLALGYETEVRTEGDFVLFLFPNTPAIQRTIGCFQTNAAVPILDFLNMYDRVKNFALDHKHGRQAVWR